MKTYRVPRDWLGEKVAIVASGPSVLEFPFERIAGLRVIAVKDGYLKVPRADVLMIGDHRYAKRKPDLSLYEGPLILYTDPHPLPESLKDPRVHFIPKVAGRGLSKNTYELRGTFSTTNLAINLAVLRGARRIYLIGVDGAPGPNGERHFTGATKETWWGRYDRQRWGYRRLVQDLAAARVEVFNLNPKSSINTFPKLDPETL